MRLVEGKPFEWTCNMPNEYVKLGEDGGIRVEKDSYWKQLMQVADAVV